MLSVVRTLEVDIAVLPWLDVAVRLCRQWRPSPEDLGPWLPWIGRAGQSSAYERGTDAPLAGRDFTVALIRDRLPPTRS